MPQLVSNFLGHDHPHFAECFNEWVGYKDVFQYYVFTKSQLKNYLSILAPVEPISLRSLRSKIKAMTGQNGCWKVVVLLQKKIPIARDF
jgi:hypothetical protein